MIYLTNNRQSFAIVSEEWLKKIHACMPFITPEMQELKKLVVTLEGVDLIEFLLNGDTNET